MSNMSSSETKNDEHSPAIIVLMGIPGTGKSSFFHHVTGLSNDFESGSLRSETNDKMSASMIPGDTADGRWRIVDTPGLDVIRESDGGVPLEQIRNWLCDNYQSNGKYNITGILWFHRISDDRMTGSGSLALKTFKELCGDEFMQNVCIVTTFWDSVEKQVADVRLQELRSDFWNDMITKGANVSEWDGNGASAQQILQLFNEKRPVALAIQREMGVEGKSWYETAAGKAMIPIEIRNAKQQECELEALRKQVAEMRETQNELEMQREHTVALLQGQETRNYTRGEGYGGISRPVHDESPHDGGYPKGEGERGPRVVWGRCVEGIFKLLKYTLWLFVFIYRGFGRVLLWMRSPTHR
ncbi:hypothetical protein BDZ91DRAFT_687467 [Kalaharituber pfeilii]|nr:hypothetical protein BDZ91DRAFT_687467 [Kalaharituber pfeilii]